MQPTYDYVNTFPPTLNVNTDGNANTLGGPNVPDEGVARRKKLLGQVPDAPAATTDYNTAKRYNRSDLGFVGGRDNEDIYAQNQGFFKSVGNGLGRLVGLTVTKLGTGLGYLAGLVGVGNDSEKYGGGFNGWIAGAGDNGMAKWFQNLEDDKIKNDWLPIYKKATEKDHGFFRHMGDLDFWTDDLTDGAAFIASSFVPGMAIGKLKLGAKALQSLSALRGIGELDEAAALSAKGVSGTVDSENLIKQGVGATIETPDIVNTIKPTLNATQEIARAIPWIDNAKIVRNIDVGTTSIINTTSQAMFSANEAKNNAYDTLIKQKDESGQNKYTVDQATQLSAKVAKDSYLMNLGALSLMNLYEANFLFKKASTAGQAGANKFETTGLFSDATLAKKTFGENLMSSAKEPLKGFITGGVWLGNMQVAIDRLNNNSDNFNLDFGDKLKALGSQYVKQTGDALTGDDTEAAKALGVGGFMGGVLGKVLGHNEAKETQKSVANLNNRVSAFKDLGNIYKTEADGSLKLENGSPILDEDKMKSWVASFNNVLSLNQVADNFKAKGIEEMAKIYQDEVFARFAKAHFDSGLSDLLYQKLNDVANIKKEDLALLGYDTDSKNKETSSLLDGFTKKTKTLESLYNNIQQNFIPPTDMNVNTTEGKNKYFDMTDKMFYLSARSASLVERLAESNVKYGQVRDNADSYNQSYNHETDGAVTKYNELFEGLNSARKGAEIATNRLDEEQYAFDRLNEGSDFTPRIKEPAPNKSGFFKDTDTDLKNSLDLKEKELNQYVQDNKEVLERLKKDARGRYMYEIGNKNLLPSVKEMERQQIVQAELGLANNATLNVLSRLADPKFGSKYYDQVYSKELERHAQEQGLYNDLTAEEPVTAPINKDYNLPKEDTRTFKTNVTEDQVNDAYNQVANNEEIGNKKEISEHIAEKIATGQELTDQEKTIKEALGKEINEKLQERAKSVFKGESDDELYETTKERDALDQKDDRTTEEETQLDQLNKKVDALEEQRQTAFETYDNESKIENSTNVKVEDKPTYKEVLNQISVNKKRVQNVGDFYMVDGQQYRKVTDLIGDRIPPDLRDDPGVQASVNAGNTIDALAKAYFAGGLTDEFKNSMSDKISDQAYADVIKSLDKIKNQLGAKGIEIVGSNVFVMDDALKVAGEIDLLGVDKKGNFKIYEVQARRGDVYRQYGKRGLGVKIRDIDAKRLSMYRNMFANQYGSIPDEIAVKFPVEVKYDRDNYKGFIDSTRMRDTLRFTPLKNVEIKMKNAEPIRIGSHFESVDMTRIFLDTFLSDKLEQDKLKYMFRNAKLEDILKGAKLTVKAAGEEFQKRFGLQQKALNNEPGDFKVKKFKDFRNKDENGEPKEFKNLYSLVGNTEISLHYEGQPMGYFSPVQTLAYKDIDGKFKILDENTDADTYSNITGNSVKSYNEFKKVASAYKKLHTELTGRLLASGGKEVTLSNEELKGLMDLKMSQGELDLVKSKEKRPDLKELTLPGVKVGNKMIPTLVNLDSNDAIKVVMDKAKKSKGTIGKYYDVDRWANQNIEQIKAAMTDQDGQKVTDNVAIIETKDGSYKIISLRAKEGVKVGDEDFVDDLGSKFTTSVNKNVFKNENIMVVPKDTEEKINLNLEDHKVVSEVFPQDDIDSLQKWGINPQEATPIQSDQIVDDFLQNANEGLKQDLEDMGLNSKEAILNDFQNGDWGSLQDYLDDFKNCK